MLDFGWKKKAETLRMVMVSGAHHVATELSPGLAKALEIFSEVVKTGDDSKLDQLGSLLQEKSSFNIQHEPAEVHGWKIEAMMYRQDGQLWWLVHATRKNQRAPSAKDVVFLYKVLEHLGAQPARNEIIGPSSDLPIEQGDGTLAFGWWTWKNISPLFDIHVAKDKPKAAVRIVPHGSRPDDGYQLLPSNLATPDKEDEPQ